MADFFPKEAMDTMLEMFGDGSGTPNCFVYFGSLCTCTGKTGQYDSSCPECIYGWIFDDPIEELIIASKMNLRALPKEMYMLYEGGLQLTIPKFNLDGSPCQTHKRLTFGDVVVVKDQPRRDRDICELNKRDYLLSFNVTEVISIKEKSKTFKQDIDYKVNLDAKKTTIEWIGDKPRSFYSVDYFALRNYLVWDDQAKVRGATDANLPKRVYLRMRPYFDEALREVTKIKQSVMNPNFIMNSDEE